MNKKLTKKTQKNYKQILFIVYNVLLVIVLLVLTTAVVSQQKIIESMSQNEFNNLVGDFTGASYEPVIIDPSERKAYVPQVDVAFDYTNQFSEIRYRLDPDGEETSPTNASIFFTGKQQLVNNIYASDKPCVDPYVLLVDTSVPEGYVEVDTKVLVDGRTIVYAASSKKKCEGYIQGATGRELLAGLKTAQSY